MRRAAPEFGGAHEQQTVGKEQRRRILARAAHDIGKAQFAHRLTGALQRGQQQPVVEIAAGGSFAFLRQHETERGQAHGTAPA